MSQPLGIRETSLVNALKVLTVERPGPPVVSTWACCRVGSRHERPGITGASHWVEHMLFKGGREFGKGQIFRQVARHGGVNNGFTNHDLTVYFETLPADALDLALRIEADRLRNSLFDPQEVASERTVVVSEREGAENRPAFLLAEEVAATAFREHPYRWSVIGHKPDLLAMTRDDLFGYYKAHYVPNNTVLVVAGRFEREKLLARVEGLFGSWPRGAGPPQPDCREPEQGAERRVVVRRAGGAALIQVAYHVPAASAPEFFALTVAATILSGASGLVMGGSVGGRTSRLHLALVRSALASGAYASCRPAAEPTLLTAGATVREGVELSRVEAVLLGEVEGLAERAPGEEEIQKARRQLRAAFAYSWDGATAIAGLTTVAEAICGHRWLETYLDRLEGVEAEDVRRVAETYLRPANRTVGHFIPTSEEGRPS